MKIIAFTVSIILVLAMLTVPANAQGRVLARAEIPFNFSAHNQDLTAGTYNLFQIGDHVIWLQNVATNRGVTLLSPQNIAESSTTRIVFRKYGAHVFLAAVIAPSYQVTIRPSRKENDIRESKVAMSTLTIKVSR